MNLIVSFVSLNIDALLFFLLGILFAARGMIYLFAAIETEHKDPGLSREENMKRYSLLLEKAFEQHVENTKWFTLSIKDDLARLPKISKEKADKVLPLLQNVIVFLAAGTACFSLSGILFAQHYPFQSPLFITGLMLVVFSSVSAFAELRIWLLLRAIERHYYQSPISTEIKEICSGS
ncbi:MAG: hypothetical protein Q7R94_01350 [bacterium]|nr:hypothetical protein [bacterium]